MSLDVKNCSVTIDKITILSDVFFSIDATETIAIIGSSGSGKTTLLRCIAGLQPYDGSITFNDQPFEKIPTEQRGIGFVDQRLNLFPHLTVFQNIAYPLRIRKISKSEIAERVNSLLEEFKIIHTAKQLPQTLSGGEQQRVALARSLIYNPQLLLLDEPFGGLDALLRYDLIMWLKNILVKYHLPTLLVTHDIREAQVLAKRAVILLNGKIAAFDTWEALTNSPIGEVRNLLSKTL